MRYLLLFLLLVFAAPVHAMDYTSFKTLPILHEGRIKPLSSFARTTYAALRDSSYAKSDKAVEFLAQSLFDPAEAAAQKIVAVHDPNLRRLLGLDAKRTDFSLTELTGPLSQHDKDVAAWLQQDDNSLSKEQKALIALYDKMVMYTQVLRSFTMILPMDMVLDQKDKDRYAPQGDISFFNLQNRNEDLRAEIDRLVKRKGRQLENYTKREQNLVELSYQIDQIRESGNGNTLFRVIPNEWRQDWLSPWDMALSGQASPHSLQILTLWHDMAVAWRNDDTKNFAQSSAKLAKVMSWEKAVTPWRLQLEQIYYDTHFLLLSLILYIGALICLSVRRAKTALWIGGGALTVHAVGILMRVLILARPPVGTLFESILFVGFVAALLLFLSERVLRNNAGLWLSILVGAALQLTALGFAQNGDTLQNLQAVLNTPFWLAVHVLVITSGYAACLCASALAQASFIWRDKIHDGLIWFVSSLALLLTATGTLLGGLWADQSWGRFWGWDPKENGALLIVLWLAWALHARLSAHLSLSLFRGAIAMNSVVVALAWFGVNLLSTGLHSYGFTSGIASGLFGFIAVQSGFIGYLLWRERHGRTA